MSEASTPATGVPAFVAAVHARDGAAARATLAPTFQGKANGKPLDADGQVRLLESFWQGFPESNFAMEPTGGSGRYVITWTLGGTHDGVYLGVPPTGKRIDFSGFIVAVADGTGVTSLDWKWDTKVFTKAVLGPDDVGEIVVKDNFRDPSRKWAREGHGGGKRKGKGKGPKPQRGPQAADAAATGSAGAPTDPARPAPPRPPRLGPDGQPLPSRPPRLGPDGQPLPPRPPRLGPDGQPLARPMRPVLGPDGQPVLGPDGQPVLRPAGRRRRGKGRGPRPDGAPGAAAATPGAAEGGAPGAGQDAPPSDGKPEPAQAEAASVPSPAQPEAQPKPDGT